MTYAGTDRIVSPEAMELVLRENKELRKDARRYRWLRKGGNWLRVVLAGRIDTPDQFDRTVDEGMGDV